MGSPAHRRTSPSVRTITIAAIVVTAASLAACGSSTGHSSAAGRVSSGTAPTGSSGGSKDSGGIGALLTDKNVSTADLGAAITAAMRTAGTAQVTSTSTGMGNSRSDGVVRFTDSGVEGAVTSSTDLMGDMQYRVIMVDGAVYARRIKDSLDGPSGWINYGAMPQEMSIGDKAYTYGMTVQAFGLGRSFSMVGALVNAGHETVNGIETTKFTTSVSRKTIADKAKSALKNQKGLGGLGSVADDLANAAVGSDVALILWIDPKGLPVRIATSVKVMETQVQAMTTFTHWGEPVDISAPAGATVPTSK